jgi:hypothetical protein
MAAARKPFSVELHPCIRTANPEHRSYYVIIVEEGCLKGGSFDQWGFNIPVDAPISFHLDRRKSALEAFRATDVGAQLTPKDTVYFSGQPEAIWGPNA